MRHLQFKLRARPPCRKQGSATLQLQPTYITVTAQGLLAHACARGPEPCGSYANCCRWAYSLFPFVLPLISAPNLDMPAIRTISIFLRLSRDDSPAALQAAAAAALAVALQLKSRYESSGWEVQTIRCLTNSFTEWCGMEIGVEAAIARIQHITRELGDACLLNIGPAESPVDIQALPQILQACPTVTATALLPVSLDTMPGELCTLLPSGADRPLVVVPSAAHAAAAACVVSALAAGNPTDNFRFGVLCNVPGGIPFFPAGYADHSGAGMEVAVGVQNVDTINAAIAHGVRTDSALQLAARLEENLVQLAAKVSADAVAGLSELGEATGEHTWVTPYGALRWRGLDVSVVPAASGPGLNMAGVQAALGLGTPGFGNAGSLAASALLTGVLKRIQARRDVLTTGYCGLMLPPMECPELAASLSAGRLDVHKLLMYSATCGVGLDCVPIPASTEPAAVAGVLADTAALAFRLHKPLAVRLFPVPDARPDDAVDLKHPHLCATRVCALE